MPPSSCLLVLLALAATTLALPATSEKKLTIVKTLPEYIIPCTKTDPEVNNCIKNTFNHLRKYLQRGIPELNMDPLDPLRLDQLLMENGVGNVRVRALFNNMTVLGAGNYTVITVKSDLSKLRIDLGMRLPRLSAMGHYEVTGQVLLFPVRSRGDFWATFNDITAVVSVYGRNVTRSGEHFMSIEKLGIDFHLGGKSRFRIKDVVNGNTVIGEAMNHFLNENSNEIIDEMKPAAGASIGKHFKSFLNQAFLQIPLRLWMRDSDGDE
ncbi:uncharacterized protein LOC132202984 [Neocloeon triangulifer]|uniref:uncharacterized protein LOC132202984 n=1 Tax=Neocloeon triangulifer TaxID=2078957 RepID=UPI00286ED161|nr:uncharacterized protein LOC132202984 [Neocloeon triangulifer]